MCKFVCATSLNHIMPRIDYLMCKELNWHAVIHHLLLFWFISMFMLSKPKVNTFPFAGKMKQFARQNSHKGMCRLFWKYLSLLDKEVRFMKSREYYQTLAHLISHVNLVLFHSNFLKSSNSKQNTSKYISNRIHINNIIKKISQHT